MASQNANIDELLAEPRETLDVEVKEWLDLTTNEHRALIAKEIIALANHGGGFFVIGFSEAADGTFTPATSRPPNLDDWSQDAIQSIVSRYLDPAIQCEVVHRPRPGSKEYHPTIIVPGGHRVPIKSKSASPDGRALVAHRVYIRRPGPAAEEPRTAEEWDRLLERCLQNRKAELLNAMRSIMEGVVPSGPVKSPSKKDDLLRFEVTAAERWTTLVQALPKDAPPRLPLGHVDFAAAIDGTFDKPSLPGLRDMIVSAVRNHSGWPPFVTLSREPFGPKAVNGSVEVWIGPEPDGSFDTPDHHDFWRISPEGFFFLRRGHSEDGFDGIKPGTGFDITTPTWRLGEAILEVSYIARALNADPESNLIFHCGWYGLSGRHLISRGNPNRTLFNRYPCAQSSYEGVHIVALGALPAVLPELVHSILAPLYVLFNFYQLPKALVVEELASMQRNQH